MLFCVLLVCFSGSFFVLYCLSFWGGGGLVCVLCFVCCLFFIFCAAVSFFGGVCIAWILTYDV